MARQSAERGLETHVIHHPHNEASALIAVHSQAVLAARGWKQAFWVVCDEAPAEEAVGALGLCADGDAWELVHLRGHTRGPRKKTADAETLARAGGWLYVFGSQYGAKAGPLQAKRHFIARFNEGLVRVRRSRLEVPMDLARPAFALHRVINDALAAEQVPLLGRPARAGRKLVRETLARAQKDGKRWRRRLHADDQPVNVEGATFLPSGHLLLGLRYPVTADGNPLLVEVDGIDRAFVAGAGDPEVTRIWVVERVGSPEAPQGVRELDQRGSTIHLLTGTLEGDDPASPVRRAVRQSERVPSIHHVLEAPHSNGTGIVRVEAREVRRFNGESNVEGVAVTDDGSVWYVRDDDEIRLERAPA